MNRTITFVSLGPGEPELITLKGLKTLQQADRIFCPATLTTSGKQVSRAAHILRALEIEEEKIHPFVLPMSKDRQKAISFCLMPSGRFKKTKRWLSWQKVMPDSIHPFSTFTTNWKSNKSVYSEFRAYRLSSQLEQQADYISSSRKND